MTIIFLHFTTTNLNQYIQYITAQLTGENSKSGNLHQRKIKNLLFICNCNHEEITQSFENKLNMYIYTCPYRLLIQIHKNNLMSTYNCYSEKATQSFKIIPTVCIYTCPHKTVTMRRPKVCIYTMSCPHTTVTMRRPHNHLKDKPKVCIYTCPHNNAYACIGVCVCVCVFEFINHMS